MVQKRKRGREVDEAAWRNQTRLFEMMPLLEGVISDRKRRLFAVACCRRFASLCPDARIAFALDVAERYADGQATDEERLLAEQGVILAHIDLRESRLATEPLVCWSRQAELLTQAASLVVAEGIYYAGDAADYGRLALIASGRGWRAEEEEEIAQCGLLREVVGPTPAGRPAFNPAWRVADDHAAEQVARWIYEARAFEDLPILADALEEAGCCDAAILDHCRQGGDHVRGCWVVDAVLDRE
jgi:hypothetical protein